MVGWVWMVRWTEALQEMMNALGYTFTDLQFDACDTGLPVSRTRLWMEGRLGDCCGQRLRDELVVTVGDICRKAKRYDIDDFLFPDYDNLFEDWIDTPTTKVARESTIGGGVHDAEYASDEQWPLLHAFAFSKAPHEADRRHYEDDLSQNQFFLAMTPRERSNLVLQLCKYPYPGPAQLFVNVEPSFDRVYHRTDMVHCILPRGQIWAHHKKRLILGVESFLLQGSDLGALKSVRPGVWANKLLHNLAGSAFSAPQFAAVGIASLSSSG